MNVVEKRRWLASCYPRVTLTVWERFNLGGANVCQTTSARESPAL